MAKNNLFELYNGIYYFYLADKQVYKTENVFFIFDVFDQNFVMIKHGTEARLKDWLNQEKAKNPAFNFKLVGTKGTPPEELNKIINNTGYIPNDLKEILVSES